MTRDIFKQMLPFLILLAVLWLMAELLERMFDQQRGPVLLDEARVTATPAPPPPTPTPPPAAPDSP